MLQELHSLAGGIIRHRATLGRRCFSHPSTLSPFPCSKEDSTASPFHAKQLPPPGPLLFSLGKEGQRRQSRGPLLSCTHLTHWPGDILPFELCCDQPCAQSRRAEVATHRLPFWHSCQMCQHSPSALLHPNFFSECTQRQARPLKRDQNSGNKLFKCPPLLCPSTFSTLLPWE